MDLIPLFEHAPASVTFEAGTTIFHMGDAADCMYVILEGFVDLALHDRVVATVGTGEFFGEMALLENQNRIATAIARTRCRLSKVTELEFLERIRTTPGFALHVLRVLASRLRRADVELSSQ